MARRGIKKQDHENLDDLTVSRVIDRLEQNKPITKKVACEILNINYNTSRLAKIIEEYKERITYTEKRKKQMKGKPFGDLELQDLIVSYLSGESIASISRRFFRSTHILKRKIDELNLPIRDKTTDYHNPKMIPDEMVSYVFEVGDYVWSTRYNCVAEITQDHGFDLEFNDCRVYSIWIFGKHNQFAYQPSFELGKLDILKQYKLRNDEFQTVKQDFNYRIQ